MRCFALSSGSRGNSFYFEGENGESLLIDMGLSFNKTSQILSEKGVDIESIQGIFITHEHGDHSSGVFTALNRINSIFYMSEGTKQALELEDEKIKVIKEHELVNIGNFRVFSVPKSHDAAEPISFLVEENGSKAAIFTDLGEVSDEVKHAMKETDILFLEANYCDEMATANEIGMSSAYITRLCSDKGHLSIDSCLESLEETAKDRQKIILCHISENLNNYEHVYVKIRDRLYDKNIKPSLRVSIQGEPTDWIRPE